MNLSPWPGVWNVPIHLTQVMGPTLGAWGAISFPEPQGPMRLELGEREKGHQVSVVSRPSERRLGDELPKSQEENRQTTMVI